MPLLMTMTKPHSIHKDLTTMRLRLYPYNQGAFSKPHIRTTFSLSLYKRIRLTLIIKSRE